MAYNNDYCEIELKEPELKPCPFCGSKAFMWHTNWETTVECGKYNATSHRVSMAAKTMADAVKAWNARA